MTDQSSQTEATVQYAGTRPSVPSIWGRYWRAYGGWRAVAGSRYFWGAVFLTVLCFPFWINPHWWETPIGILPDLLGFTLGGMAILIGICEARVMKVLSWREDNQKASDLAIIVATFAHFVIVQAFALLAAILCNAFYVPLGTLPWIGSVFVNYPALDHAWTNVTQYAGWGVSFLLFIYSILLIFATTLELFRVSSLLEMIFIAGKDQHAEGCRYEPPTDSQQLGERADSTGDDDVKVPSKGIAPEQGDDFKAGR